MDKKQASSIIENTFNSSFNRETFISFVGNLFNLHSHDFSRQNINIYDSYKQHVKSLEVVAKYSGGHNDIDILIVTLMRDTSLDRARTMQRNFVSRYLSEKQGGAAIVAFHSPDAEDWRFSLIKMEYKLSQTETGFKFEQEINRDLSAKRWSFLVGKNERSHTAQNQLVGILANDQESPSLDDLEQAFNIESVTKEFFEKYTDLFLRMKDSLDSLLESDYKLRSDFESKEINTSDFAKKTMGQMAFLYFLQKKGWFGVAPGKEWGSGVKNFLREVFDRRENYGENFFDDVLEPLFYEALAQDRGNESIYPKLNNYRMPFLNGGLFEPMNGYSWETTHIRLPDELFSNKTETYEGDGILDVFDRYNFTVNESDLLEMEVAVDPEMLGKVFENLLEIKDRESSATFYTPREIVHYICQESLINYLETKTNNLIPQSDIDFFIRKGSQIIQNDKSVIEQGKESENLKYLLPQSIRDQSTTLDGLLSDIKICDPAVGSGAFPLGMLNEIVAARSILGIHLRTNPTSYNLKLHAIANSIYGVDIDPGAIEIAKLRFWLSLVVEEDNPTPLPNLDHKLMQGNSLISQYEGIELFDDDFLKRAELVNTEKQVINNKFNALQKEVFSLHSSGELTSFKRAELEKEMQRLTRRLKFLDNKINDDGESFSLFEENQSKKIAQRKSKLLQKKIKQYVTVVSKTDKENLKCEIENLKWDLIELTVEEECETDKLDEIKDLRKRRIKPFFIWKLEFGEVFKNSGGFDVVIGNPPYGISIKDDYRRMVLNELGKVPDFEIYYYFIELGKRLLKNNGINSFITPNTFIFNVFAANYREKILKEWDVKMILDCTAFKLFDDAVVHNAITVFKKTPKGSKQVGYKNTLDASSFHSLIIRDTKYLSKEVLLTNNINWGLVFKLPKNVLMIINKIKKMTGSISDLFEVSQGFIPYRRKDLIAKYGEVEGNAIVDERKWHSTSKKTDEYKEEIFGRSLTRYSFEKTGKYVRYGKHLAGYVDSKFFNQERILVREITNPFIIATYIKEEFVNDPQIICVIKKNVDSDLLTLWAILNSKLATFFHFNASPKATKGSFPKILVKDIKNFPIPPWEDCRKITQIANKLFDCSKSDGCDSHNLTIKQKEIESEIDELIFNIYGLTHEERQVVLNTN